DGLNTMSTVFYRYAFAVVILAVAVRAAGHSFRISKHELGVAGILGFFFSVSSLALYASFNFMDAGLASTILFCYPVMVAIIMVVIFHEKITISTATSLLLAIAGIALLSKGDAGSHTAIIGVVLVIISSLTYSVYIVSVNRIKLSLNNLQLTFWVSLFGLVTIGIASMFGSSNHIQPLPNMAAAGWAFMLGLVPTVLSLIFMNIAIKIAGSTPAAIMGALEPITAVIIGNVVFNEAITVKLLIGILLILTAVILIILSNNPKKAKEYKHAKKQLVLLKHHIARRNKFK
nr:DMT family transporter [Bacteroidales bacterium]